MIEFKRKYSMQNGNKVTQKNWHKVLAKSKVPDYSHYGNQAIEEARRYGAKYFETWKLVYEKNEPERSGFIFREINHNGGINGHHKTFKEAIWNAINNHISVSLEE